VTTVTQLTIGGDRASLRLACGHLVELVTRPFPTPGTLYVCPVCRESDSLAAQFSAVELRRLRFWQWLRLTGRAE
jgi:hypothetical protein